MGHMILPYNLATLTQPTIVHNFKSSAKRRKLVLDNVSYIIYINIKYCGAKVLTLLNIRCDHCSPRNVILVLNNLRLPRKVITKSIQEFIYNSKDKNLLNQDTDILNQRFSKN